MALGGAVQGVFVLVVVLMYSAMVWRSLDRHFGDEYKKHLAKDYKNIQKMKQEKMAAIKSSAESKEVPVAIKSTEVPKEVPVKDEHFRKSKEMKMNVPSAQEKCGGEIDPVNKYIGDSDEDIDDGVCPFIPPPEQDSKVGG